MELTHPGFLLLLLLLPLVAWVALGRSQAELSAPQRLASLATRSLVLVAISLALAGARWLHSTDALAVLFVFDDSQSITEDARTESAKFLGEAMGKARRQDISGVVGFAAEPKIWLPPSPGGVKGFDLPRNPENARLATDVGRALDFAAAVFPAGAARRVVLLTDGNDTGGRATEAAARLAEQGVRVDVRPMENPSVPEVLVERIEMPRGLRPGEPFTLGVRVRSNTDTTAAVRLYSNRFLVGSQQARLRAGWSRIEFPRIPAPSALTTYDAEIIPGRDTVAGNNRGAATAGGAQARRILVIDPQPERVEAFAGALRRAGFEVEARSPAGLPAQAQELQQFGLLVLSDTPASVVGLARMETISRWVTELGGGFLATGGPDAFGAGGYYNTPLERVLPVRMEHSDRQEQPTVALLISLDRSGSMQAMVEGQTKMALANQGAALALDVLGPRDYFGLHAVDTRIHEVVPLARSFDRATAVQRILSVTSAGGGIYVYTALAEAERVLAVNDARTRHLILFADAADAEEKEAGSMGDGTQGAGSALDFASSMAAKGITVSVVALGLETDSDTVFLRELAERGGGRFYLTNDALSLPQIFTSETMRVTQMSISEGPFMAVAAAPSSITRGIDWSGAPFLLGMNVTKPKETAQILLQAETGEPIFAMWRHGLGNAAAFMSDIKDRWSSEWLAWPGFAALWSQAADGLLPSQGAGPLTADAVIEGESVRISVDASRSDGAFLNDLEVDIVRVDAGGQGKRRAVQTAPGRYEAVFPLLSDGTALFSVQAPGLQPVVVTASRSYPREFLAMETNRSAIEAIAKRGRGRVLHDASEVFVADGQRTQKRWDLGPLLLTLSALLLPLDVFVRRWSWERPTRANSERQMPALASRS